jgi:integrase
VGRGYVVANVADAVDPPAKDDSVSRSAWSAEEVRRFLEVTAEDRFSAVWWLVLASGIRRGEMCGLQWPDVDDSRITVRRQVLVRPGRTWDEDRIYVRESRRVRTVTVDEGTAAALRRWKAHQAEEKLAFGPAHADQGWVVAEADGSLVQPDTLSSRWKRLERLAGVRPIGLHGARHTHATLALAAEAVTLKLTPEATSPVWGNLGGMREPRRADQLSGASCVSAGRWRVGGGI